MIKLTMVEGYGNYNDEIFINPDHIRMMVRINLGDDDSAIDATAITMGETEVIHVTEDPSEIVQLIAAM